MKPMRQMVCALLAVTLLIPAAAASPGSGNPLWDVQGHWAQKEIQEAVAAGWVDGYPDGSFQPEKTITRAEFSAMVAASRALGRWRLSGCTVYVTLEPCLMCAGLMVNARIDRCVFGASDPKGGALGTLYDVSHDPRLNHEFEVTPGVLADEAASQLRAFFRARREARKAAKAQAGAEAITDPTEQPAS